MRVLFLDMDGVLCTIRSHIAQNGTGLMQHLDREAVGMLNRLDVTTVLSSTWRKFYDRPWMENHLRTYGWTGEFHEDWSTPVARTGIRGQEIQSWLNQHPEVTRYCILDDDSDMLPEQAKFFVRTHHEDGLSFRNFLQAKEILYASVDSQGSGSGEPRSLRRPGSGAGA